MTPLLKQIGPVIASTLVTSAVGGGLGTYVAFRVLSQKVDSMESRQTEDRAKVDTLAVTVEANRRAVDDQLRGMANSLADVGKDVAYIRGRMENGKGPS